MTTFVRSAILSTNYFCFESYIFCDGHFSVVYLHCLMRALKSLLDVLYCRATALDKLLNSGDYLCIRWIKVPKLSFKGCADNKRVRRQDLKKQQNTGY